MLLKKEDGAYNWRFCRIGGVTRVLIENGEDIRHLAELDQKMWTVLSCPVDGLEFPRRSLEILDDDHDGRIRVPEVIAAAQWLCSVMRNPDLLTRRQDRIRLSEFDEGNPHGARMLKCAKAVLKGLHKEGQEDISIADTADSAAIFADTLFNGDGVILEACAENGTDREIIRETMRCIGSTTDRSGKEGVTREQIDAFLSACADYAAWAEAGKGVALPYGADTAAMWTACKGLDAKMQDFFMRCKIMRFASEEKTAALDISAADIEGLGEGELAGSGEALTRYPLSKVNAEGVLPLDLSLINPAWQAAVAGIKDIVFKGQNSCTLEAWNAVMASFVPFVTWSEGKQGAQVEDLGAEKAAALAGADRSALDALIEKDLSFSEEAGDIDLVDRFLHLLRDFFPFLHNYVTFTDFYASSKETPADFQAGTLYVDQRSLDLCLPVLDAGKQSAMAPASGIFLIYCTCTDKELGKTRNIVAALTGGDTGSIREGQNCIFYDREGHDWDAVITKIIANPVSIRQAFWSPYRKVAEFIEKRAEKAAADKDSKNMADATAAIDKEASTGIAEKSAEKKPAFDIAKFAGIFAAIGLALGYIGSFLVAIATGFLKLTWWQMPLSIAAVLLLISGPSMLLAWNKLRKRNLAPVLNANGWAVNANVLINTRFGASLTHLAKYPKLNLQDPYAARKMPAWLKVLIAVLCLLLAAAAVLYFTGKLQGILG